MGSELATKRLKNYNQKHEQPSKIFILPTIP